MIVVAQLKAAALVQEEDLRAACLYLHECFDMLETVQTVHSKQRLQNRWSLVVEGTRYNKRLILQLCKFFENSLKIDSAWPKKEKKTIFLFIFYIF